MRIKLISYLLVIYMASMSCLRHNMRNLATVNVPDQKIREMNGLNPKLRALVVASTTTESTTSTTTTTTTTTTQSTTTILTTIGK